MSVRIIAEDLLPTTEAELEAETVAEAAEEVGLQRRTGLIILVNGRLADWKTPLRDGDIVEFVPALGGG